MVRFSFIQNSGRKWSTGSSSPMRPRSASTMMLVAVAIGLVKEARSNTVSTVIGLAIGIDLAHAVRLLEEYAIAPSDGDDASRELVVGQSGGHGVVDAFDGSGRRDFGGAGRWRCSGGSTDGGE